MELPSIFLRYRDPLEATLRELVQQNGSLLSGMAQYHMGWIDREGHPVEGAEGKQLRPTLCLLSSEAVGGDWRSSVPAAAALELVHAFSLVHDDIQDFDRERRHRPTVWTIWGVGQAINVGDGLAAMATLASLRGPADRALGAAEMLARACLTMIEGQCMDLEGEARLEISRSLYLDLVGKKTGALIAAAMEIGAYMGSGDRALGLEFGRSGMEMGLAFQVQDDTLGIWGVSERTGKPVGSDLRRKKRTLPLILGMERASGADADLLARIWREGAADDDQVAAAVRVLDSLQVRRDCLETAAGYSGSAMNRLRGLPLSAWSMGQFEELGAFLNARDR